MLFIFSISFFLFSLLAPFGSECLNVAPPSNEGKEKNRMCGILGLWWTSEDAEFDRSAIHGAMLDAGRPRGPDRTRTADAGIHGGPPISMLAFHRLAIHDLSERADQPFRHNTEAGPASLVCNGEIYNYPELRRMYPAIASRLVSQSDCEILLPLWDSPIVGARSLSRLVEHLDGVFAIVLAEGSAVSLVRDRIGVRPLFYVHHPLVFAVASTPAPLELLCAHLLGSPPHTDTGLAVAAAGGSLGLRIVEVHPRTLVRYHPPTGALTVTPLAAATLPTRVGTAIRPTDPAADALAMLRASVRRRLASDRPVCCLLSGGIDSSAVACLLAELLRPLGRTLATFSIGQPGSEDLRCARLVAEALGTDHHEVTMDPGEALALLPAVVAATATYDVTTVRASTPMWMLCRHIARTTDYRVVFSGEGADEMAAGYLYFHSAPPGPEGDRAVEAECLRLVSSLHGYDVLRADRCTASHGLELREPFLDRRLLDWTLGLPGSVRRPRGGTEKVWLRGAMALHREGALADSLPCLPEEIIWRRKAAFSDAVSPSASTTSAYWYQQIQQHLAARGHGPADARTEAAVYRQWFGQAYPHYEPHRPLWLPRWQPADAGIPPDEPSATVLVR